MQATVPPPYRQPPIPGSVGQDFGDPHLPGLVSDSHAQESLRAYSTKFPTDRSVLVNTSDKIADVGRIQSYPPQPQRYQGGHAYPDQNPGFDGAPTAKVVWTDEQKLVCRPGQSNAGQSEPQQNYVQMVRGADYGVVYPRGQQHQYGVVGPPTGAFQNYGQHNPAQFSQQQQQYPNQQAHSPYYTLGEVYQGRANGEATPNSTLGRELIRDACNKMYQNRLPTSPELHRAAVGSLHQQTQGQGSMMNNNQPPLELKVTNDEKKGKILTKAYHQLKDVLAGKFTNKSQTDGLEAPDNDNERNIGNEQRSLNNVGSSNPGFESENYGRTSYEGGYGKPTYAMSSPRIARQPYVCYPSVQTGYAQQSPKLHPRPLQPVTQPQQIIGDLPGSDFRPHQPGSHYDVPSSVQPVGPDFKYPDHIEGFSSGHVSGTSLSDGEKRGGGQSGSTSDSGIQNQWQNRELHNMSQESDLARHPSLLELSKSILDQSSDWVDMTQDQSALDTSGRASDSVNQNRDMMNATPPLPPLDESPVNSPTPSRVFESGNNPRPDLLEPSQPGVKTGPPVLPKPNAVPVLPMKKNKNKGPTTPRMGTGVASGVRAKNAKNAKKSLQLNSISIVNRLNESEDIASTTTGLDLDLESLLHTHRPTSTINSTMSQSEDDLSTIGGQTDMDPLMIRKQLEGLESMYFEVMKMLDGKKVPGGSLLKNQQRKITGSISSLPSSISSRPAYREKRKYEDRYRSRDSKSINKRFQRLESHVVTLARSVAHLSSEMRTQHLVIKEIENLRQEMGQLRVGQPIGPTPIRGTPEWDHWNERVKKLTNFFGDEPPLLRIFLKKLGYEKYASLFEQEKIGLVELPYLTEDRLQKMGLPMGPRLRIMQEARAPSKPELYIL